MIYAVLGFGLLLRLISLNQSLWFDEGINIMAAKTFSFWGMITQYAVADFHPPLWFGILWIWGKTFGYSEITARMPSVILGVATIYITYLIGKKLISKNGGFLAAILLALNPLHIYYSQEARMYALAAFAVALNIFLLVKVAKGEKVNLFWLILSNLFIMLSDYVAYFIFPAEFLFFLFFKKGLLKKWFLSVGLAILFNIWWWPVFLQQLNTGSVAASALPTWKFVAGSFDTKTLPLTFVKFIIGRISLANKTLYFILLIPLVALFTYLFFKAIKNMNKFPKQFLLFWFFGPLFFATAVSFFIPVFNYFRVLYIVPAFVILVAAGILTLTKFKKVFLILIVSVELFCSLLYLLIPSNQREDWKGLVAHFQNIKPQIILLESSGSFPVFDYYAKNSLNVKGALSDFPARDENEVSLVNLTDKIYLLEYMVDISDPNRFVSQKLTALGYEKEKTMDFHGVGFVYEYVKK